MVAYPTWIADAHCASLEALTIEISPDLAEPPTEGRRGLMPFLATYKRLRRLVVKVPFSEGQRRPRRDFLESITPERFPVLKSLVLDAGLAADWTNLPDRFRRILARPTLRYSVEQPSYLRNRPPLLDYARPSSTGLIIRGTSDVTADLERQIFRHLDAPDFEPHGSLRTAVDDTISFLRRRFEDAKVQNDVVGMQRLAELLKEPTLERMFIES